MDTKFTPGPWRLVEELDEWTIPFWRVMTEIDASRTSSLIATVNGHRVQIVPGLTKTPGGLENARLIAAAPDMYEALQYALKELTACKDLGMSLNKSIDLATAALAKVQP